MPTKAITPRLADNLRLLAASQLQTQAARSAALDGGALGVMAVDAAATAIVIGARGAYGLWIVALALLVLSAGLAVCALLVRGAKEIGPLVTDILSDVKYSDDKELEQSLLEDLADETLVNNQGLARKDPLFICALALLVLAILVELAGRAVQ
jgi:hypothetical protein